MSQNDSFIDEVTEELRRDRLFATFRRYGWIGAVLIAAVVGGTAWQQWSAARDATRAEGFGDAVLKALDAGTPQARREALATVPATDTQLALRGLIAASDPQGDRAATLAALDALIADAALDPAYRDLAVLRRVSVAGTDAPLADRRAALEGIAAPGRPYRVLAAEQLAYLLLEEGRDQDAIAALRQLASDQEATPAQKARVGEVITVLGGEAVETSGG